MSTDTVSENNPQEETGIGEVLRAEREKKGISKDRLAEIIKVRENVIDALENEDWEKLPARVFVKGFIRSYTISIGYDTKKALRLFDKSVPDRDEDSPVPLTGAKNKNRTMYYVVTVLIILAAAVYLFTVGDNVEKNYEADNSASATSPLTAESDREKNNPGQAASISEPDTTENRAVTGEKPSTASIKEPEEKEIPQEIAVEDEALASSEKIVEETAETSKAEETFQETYPAEEDPGPETITDDPPAHTMSLSAKVNMRTYVRVIVDDNPPKEYIFQPGKTPSWTAERGFEVKVGNAGGIEFEFNGENIGTVGGQGRVRTVRFPEDFETEWEE